MDVLRAEGLKSVRFASETGETGAAAVLLDGELASADVMLALQADGHEVTTVEALNTARELHPIQQAFADVGALQSGYSSGAMVLGTLALLRRSPSPSEGEVRDMLSGILDRESGYVKPVEAVLRAASVLRGEPVEPFAVHVVEALTDGVHASAYDPSAMPPDVRPAVPKVIPSRDVPDLAVVGHPELKVDIVKLAKGNPAFTDDIELRGTLTAKVLRSPHAHARILDIDDSAARALPGVHEVLHYKNTKRIKYASGGQSYPNPHPYDQVSFDNKVRHWATAWPSRPTRRSPPGLPPDRVTTTCRPSSTARGAEAGRSCHPDEDDTEHIGRPQQGALDLRRARRREALAEAPHYFEQTFRVHQVQQCPMEPHVAVAWLDEDERMVIRTATQVPFHVRRMIAPLIEMPVRDIRVIKPRIGGGFGAKQEMLIEDIVALLAIQTRRQCGCLTREGVSSRLGRATRRR